MISCPEVSSNQRSPSPVQDMKGAYSALLLFFLLGTATCLFNRYYYILGRYKDSWDDAQKYCRSEFSDIVSIESMYDFSEFMSIMSQYIHGQSWIGLSKSPEALEFTQWSDGRPVGFTYWGRNQPEISNDQNCVKLLSTGDWITSNCSELLPYSCYVWEPQIILVSKLKTWDEALRYCRKKYTDLMSLSTDTDFLAINTTLNGQTIGVWTGLRFLHGSWFWTNLEPLMSNANLTDCPAPSFRCGAVIPGTGILENRNCMENMNFICYN